MTRLPRSLRNVLACLAAVTSLFACGDSSSPQPAEPFGEFELRLIGDQTLSYYLGTYLGDTSYDEIDHGSLRVLSRGRLVVMKTIFRYNVDGSFRLAVVDSVTFAHGRTGDLVILEFRDPLEVLTDTLDLLDLGENVGLRVRSVHYIRGGSPASLVLNGLYIK